MPRFDLLKSPLAERNLLEASAGTGKTFTIAALYLRLLLETDLTVDRILVVTFTEAATEELRDRIRQRIREAYEGLCGETLEDIFLKELLAGIDTTEQREQARTKLREALICFDEAAIYTIHGFCQRILQDKAFEAGALFDTELITDQTLLLDEIAQDYWRQHCANQTGPFASYLFEKKIIPSSFAELLKQITGDPGITVIPDRDAEDLTTHETEWQSQRETLQESWQEHHEDIKELLLNADGLNRGKYNKVSLLKWFAEIDSYFSSSTAFQAPEKLFARLTTSSLIEGTKKNAVTPQHPFFDLAEDAAENYTIIEAAYIDRIIALKVDFIRYLRRELPRRKQAQNIRHFDDLLLDVRDRLTSSVGPRLCDS
ncbi:MAG: UvrD-helicase domain-containing protein, partial [Desulfuromonadales bacterium]|nr:UvrD-helicase domain-containing protein [Desulfuromonadales bacterium]